MPEYIQRVTSAYMGCASLMVAKYPPLEILKSCLETVLGNRL